MVIEAVSGISLINSALMLSTLSDPLKRRLVQLGVNTEEVKNDEEAEAIIAQKEEEPKKVEETGNETKGVSYYDKQLMSDIRLLAQDLGLYISEDIDMEDLMYNISVQIAMLKSLFENNDNLKEVAKQFEDRYQNIYATYMSNRNTLETQTLVNLL